MSDTAPASNTRTKKLLVGCGLGCLLPVVLLISTCVGFNAWLQAPGELLEPQRLLDDEAVGYAEWRLELENPATQRFFEAMVGVVDRVQQTPDMPPAVEMLMRWNQRRQARELRRLFPANVSWLMYPNETSDAAPDDPMADSHVLSLSIQRMGHQLIVADWAFSFAVSRTAHIGSQTYRGEKLLALADIDSSGEREEGLVEQDDTPGADAPAYLFLNPAGVFFGSDLSAAQRAVDRLNDADTERGNPGDLETLFRGLDEDWQFRGAILNRSGQLERLAMLFGLGDSSGQGLVVEGEPGEDGRFEAADRESFFAALERTSHVSFVGGVQEDGSGKLSFSFAGPPELGTYLDAWAQDIADRMSSRDLAAEATTRVEDGLVLVELELADLVGALESFDPMELEELQDLERELEEQGR